MVQEPAVVGQNVVAEEEDMFKAAIHQNPMVPSASTGVGEAK